MIPPITKAITSRGNIYGIGHANVFFATELTSAVAAFATMEKTVDAVMVKINGDRSLLSDEGQLKQAERAVANFYRVYDDCVQATLRLKADIARRLTMIDAVVDGNSPLHVEIRQYVRSAKPVDAIGYLLRDASLFELDAIVAGLHTFSLPTNIKEQIRERRRLVRQTEISAVAVKPSPNDPAATGIDAVASESAARAAIATLDVARDQVAMAEDTLKRFIVFVAGLIHQPVEIAYGKLTSRPNEADKLSLKIVD